MMADLIMKCSHCGKELTGDVYRITKGFFGDKPIDHFLEEFKFKKHLGYFCSIKCLLEKLERR